MSLQELEYLYREEIRQESELSAEEKWLQVYYSQFDYNFQVVHPRRATV